MNAVILKCKPFSAFHFGQVAVDADTSLNDTSEFLHSDTLFSAIINLAARVYPSEVNTLLALFGHNDVLPKVRLSSGFYCLQKGESFLYFLPKPLSSQFTNREEHKAGNDVHDDAGRNDRHPLGDGLGRIRSRVFCDLTACHLIRIHVVLTKHLDVAAKRQSGKSVLCFTLLATPQNRTDADAEAFNMNVAPLSHGEVSEFVKKDHESQTQCYREYVQNLCKQSAEIDRGD